MSNAAIFFAGCAVGGLVCFVMLALAQAAAKPPPVFAVEDAAAERTAQERTAIEQKRDAAHAAIDQLSPAEIDRVLNGAATLDDIMRERPTAPISSGKPA